MPQLTAEGSPHKNFQKNTDLNCQLYIIVGEYNIRNRMDYLKKIAHNMSLKKF